MTNITRADAQQRSAMLATHAYQVLLDLSGEAVADPENFWSTSTVEFDSEGGRSHIDLIADQVAEASIDGQLIDVTGFTGSTLPFETTPGRHTLSVRALCRYSHTGEGLHRFVDPSDQREYLFTQFEIADARRVFANFDQPDLKATWQLSVIAPAHWVVVSNSVDVEPQLLEGTSESGVARWDFAPVGPVSTYITALVAGDYHVEHGTVESAKGTLQANLLCRQSVRQYLDSDRIRTTTQRGFEVFEKAYGTPYAFDSYDQVFVPEFNAGAMENAGCVTIRDEYLFRSRVTSAAYEGRDNTILHELAHMWFGDLVTMTWWDDLWLNESFAEFMSHFAQIRIVADHGGIDPWVSFANARKNWAYNQDQLPTTHPIAADMVDLFTVEQNFDGITYAKGASTLKQLVALVGEEAFLKGVSQYIADHAWGNTTLPDLLGALEQASGRDLSWFTGEWLEKAGVNTIRPQFEVADGTYSKFAIVQSAHQQWPTLRHHRLNVGLYDIGADGTLACRQSVPVEIEGERTELPQLDGLAVADLVLLNDGDLTYAKVRLDEDSLKVAIDKLDTLADPLARSLVWNAAWDMTRDAEMTSAAYVDLVLTGVASERDMTAAQSLVAQAQMAATQFTAPELRPQVRNRLVSGLVEVLRGSEPGSDHQLAMANGLVQAIHTPTGAALLQGWLEGDEVPEGLEIDQDMRWRIITALARIGTIDAEAIAAEAERDDTIAGTEQAAGATAALANAETKARSWERAIAEPGIANQTHFQICLKFQQFDQDELLAPYGDKYLEVAGQISRNEGDWPVRGYAAISTVIARLFPIVPDAAFVERVDAFLAGDVADQVRRLMSERRDAMVRALAAQQAR